MSLTLFFRIRRLAAASALALLVLPALSGAPAAVSRPRLVEGLPGEALSGLGLALSADQRADLLADGELAQSYSGAARTELCPVPSLAPSIGASLKAVNPTIGIECLAVVPLPAPLSARVDRDLALFNLLVAFSRLKGIEYWSESRQAMRVFFLSSQVVKSPTDRQPVPDPRFTTLPAEGRVYLEQEDSSFGTNLYEVSSASRVGVSHVAMVNLNQVWYGIVPVLAPRALAMHLVLQPSPDGAYLYLYGGVAINASKAFGIEEKATTSYLNRVRAMFAWYLRSMAALP
jgi:hypothetical protein